MATRRFIKLTTENTDKCNLTELNASESVDKGYVTHNDWLAHVNRYAFTWKMLATGSLKGARSLLDVGCGKLQLPHFLWRNRFNSEGFQYWGLELRATEKWVPAEDEHWQVPITIVKTDVLKDDYSAVDGWPGQFDVVTCFEIFEHIPRAKGRLFVEKLFQWTKPGGTCLFSTPNAGVSDSTAENHLDPETGESREWSYNDKMSLVTDVGFLVDETFGTFCGVTHLPAEVRERFKTDPILAKAKTFLSHAAFTTFVSCAFPQYSNNSLFRMTRPR